MSAQAQQVWSESSGVVEGSARVTLRDRISAELEALSGDVATSASVQVRVRWLGQLLAGLADADELNLTADSVGFGAIVVVKDLESGGTMSFTVMSGSSMDVAADQVSMESPIGRALWNGRRGDVVAVETPSALRRFRIREVTTLLEQFNAV